MKKIFIGWQAILKHGVLLGILLTAVVILGFLIEPLIFATDLPEVVQEQIGEVPPAVFPLALGLMLTITFSSLFFSFRMNREIFKERREDASYLNLLLNAFLVLNFMNLWDAVVVDVLLSGIIQPDFMTIQGAEEHIREHNTTAFHFIAFLKGQPFMIIFAAISAGIFVLTHKRKSNSN
ncbi:MAG: hypothetical protein AAF519_21080 [Bacteroidota bacterium]